MWTWWNRNVKTKITKLFWWGQHQSATLCPYILLPLQTHVSHPCMWGRELLEKGSTNQSRYSRLPGVCIPVYTLCCSLKLNLVGHGWTHGGHSAIMIRQDRECSELQYSEYGHNIVVHTVAHVAHVYSRKRFVGRSWLVRLRLRFKYCIPGT